MRSIEINGKTRHFEFGTYTFKIIRELIGIKHVEEVFDGIRNSRFVKDEDGKIRYHEILDDDGDEVPMTEPVYSQVEHIEYIVTWLFACAKHGSKIAKEEIDFDDADVSGWLDDIGFQATQELMGDLIRSYKEKNEAQKKTIAQN